MRSSWKYQALSLAALVATGLSHGALAANPTVALAVGNSITTASGLTYTITGCIYVLAGTSQASCAGDNAVLETSGTGRSAIMEVLGAGGGSLFSLAGAPTDTPTYDDLTFDLKLTSAAPGVTLTSFTDTLAGTGSAAYPNEVTAGVTSSSTSPSIGLTTNLLNLSDTANFTAFNTATASIALNVDLKVTTQTFEGGNQGALALNSVTYRAPEPASIALFGTAFTGLVAVRRRVKRPERKTAVVA